MPKIGVNGTSKIRLLIGLTFCQIGVCGRVIVALPATKTLVKDFFESFKAPVSGKSGWSGAVALQNYGTS